MSTQSEGQSPLRRRRVLFGPIIAVGLVVLPESFLSAQTNSAVQAGKNAPAVVDAAKPRAVELAIKAAIDGRDELRVTREGCEWIHHEWGWPANVTLNGQAWNPQEQPKFRFDDPARFLPADARFAHPELIVKKGRGRVTLRKESADAVVIQFHDMEIGSDEYEVAVRFRDLPWLLTGTPRTPPANARELFTGDLRVTATVDGNDELRIYRDRAEWHHQANAWPTGVKINGHDWTPEQSPRLDNSGKTEFLPEWAMFAGASHFVLHGRGRVNFFIQPDHLVLRFSDPDPGGDVYDVIVHQGESFNPLNVAEADEKRIVEIAGRAEHVPHPSDRKIPTQRDVAEQRRKWDHNRIVVPFEKHSRHDPKWDAAAHAYLERLNREPQETVAAMVAAGDELVDLGCDDPLVCYQHGWQLWRSRQYSRSEIFMRHAVLGFEKSTYPRRATRRAPAVLARLYAEQGLDRADEAYALVQRSLQETSEALAEPLEGSERRALLADLRMDLSKEARGLLSDHEPALLQQIARNDRVDPWIEHVLVAGYLYRQGWQRRGDGFADTVTQEGWGIFHSCLSQARAHFITAWGMHPEFPEAAAELIMTDRAVGGLDEESPRFWFDQAVAAQIDAPRAHSQILWASRPRWGGSHEEMLKLGLECLNTRRFDTVVPEVLHDAVMDISSENGDLPELLAELEAEDDVRKGLAACEKESPENLRKRRMTQNLLTLHYLGLRDEAKARFDALRGEFDEQVFAARRINPVLTRYEFENPLHEAKGAPAVETLGPLFQAASTIVSFAVSPNGERVAAGGTHPEHLLTVWNAAGGEAQKFPVEPLTLFRKLQFSPDSEWLAGIQYLPNSQPGKGATTGAISVWKVADQSRRQVFAPGQQELATFCWLPDNRNLVLGLAAQAGLWSPERGRFVAYTPPVGVYARALAVSSRDQTLAVGYLNGSVKLYRLAKVADLDDPKEPLTLEHLADLDKHPTAIDFLQFSPDGKTLVSSSFGDRSAWIWDVTAKTPRHRVQGWHVAISPDGSRLATAGGTAPPHAAVVWNVKTGEALLRCQAPEDEDLSGLAFTPDGQFLLAPAGGTNLLVWKMDGK